MAKMSPEEMEQCLIRCLKEWQPLEDEAIKTATDVMARTRNPLISLIMEIIAHDSAMHRRVQQFIIDSIEKTPMSVTPQDLEDISDLIQKHIALERRTIDLAEKYKGIARLFPQRYLLNYLLQDERKHDLLLERFEEIRKEAHSDL
jgi:hypothetical protein